MNFLYIIFFLIFGTLAEKKTPYKIYISGIFSNFFPELGPFFQHHLF